LDVILLAVMITGLAFMISSLTGYDSYTKQMDELETEYEQRYGVSFDLSEQAYDELAEADRGKVDEAYAAYSADERVVYVYNMMINLILLTTSLSILCAYLVLELMIPLIFGNGQTVGKKVFGIGLMQTNGVRVSTFSMFVRTVLGKCTIGTLVPAAIIILSINRMNSDVRMISVMRDSYLKFRLSDGELGLDKLTHAHAFGGGVNAVEGLNRCLDLNIKEFVVFDWKAVADTVDTLGGIEVNVKKNEVGDLNTWGPETAENVGKSWTRVRHTGMQTLDGPQAVTYCRIRKNSGGDTSRGSRYKTVMAAVMKKAASNPMKLNALSEEVMPQVRTNMSQTQLATLIMRAPFMHSEKSIAWPKKYYGGIVGEVWYAVPQTLNPNVRRLHRKAFGQKNYTPSETCRSINDEIINVTGIQ
jgi:LCP family protein required for cell wall assembly